MIYSDHQVVYLLVLLSEILQATGWKNVVARRIPRPARRRLARRLAAAASVLDAVVSA